MENDQAVQDEQKNKYFAHEEDDKEFGDKLIDLVEAFDKYIGEKNIYKLEFENYRELYYSHFTQGDIAQGGETGEMQIFNVNLLAHYMTGITNMIVSRPMAFQPRVAINSAEATEQIKISEKLLEYEYEQNGEEQRNEEATTDSLVTGLAWESITWDAHEGPDLKLQDGTTQKMGKPKYQLHFDSDVIREPGRKDVFDNDWLICREWKNKYEFAERYKDDETRDDLFDKILNQPKTRFERTGYFFGHEKEKEKTDNDDIPVYYFYHKRNILMPKGSRACVLEDGTIVYRENDLLYKDMPVAIMRAKSWKAMNFGWTVFYDILPLQKYMRFLTTAMATNQEAGAVNTYYIDETLGDVKMEQWQRRAWVKGKGPPPVPISLTNTPGEVFSTFELLGQFFSMFTAISELKSGNLPNDEKLSGTAIGALLGQTLEFNQSIDKSFNMFNERKAELILENYRLFGDDEREIEIVGDDSETAIESFKGSDFDDVKKIHIDRGNPLTNTRQGRQQFAMWLMQTGHLTSVQDMITVATTGNLEVVTNKQSKEDILIQEENEQILEGIAPPAAAFDDHLLHISRHKDPLSGVKVRQDKKVLQSGWEHIQDHLNQLAEMNMKTPQLAMLLKQAMPMGPPQQQGMGINPQALEGGPQPDGAVPPPSSGQPQQGEMP